tara:strand:+ start:84 stop:353 length:270 start_codon:yes stop_codon:yes gene_type:complete
MKLLSERRVMRKFIFARRQEMKTLDYISKNELANWLGVSLSTINRKLPELPAIKLGNARKSRVIFSVPKVNEYLENLTPTNKKGAENKF